MTEPVFTFSVLHDLSGPTRAVVSIGRLDLAPEVGRDGSRRRPLDQGLSLAGLMAELLATAAAIGATPAAAVVEPASLPLVNGRIVFPEQPS